MEHAVVTREEWLARRTELLAAEKELTKQKDELAAQRRQLPWVRVDADYVFEGEDGPTTLLDLFDGHGQLVVYHFMFGADWEEGCPSCSFWADNYDGIGVHLAHRDTALAAVSNGPLDRLLSYRERMGWSFPWVSAAGTTFNADFAVADSMTYNFQPVDEPIGELPGLSVFVREGDDVFHTYSAYARGLDVFNSAYQLLDMTPKGRDEDDLPWSMAWLRRHDQYED
ncbi:MAG: DUF899 domain-containing protein [Ilumatobacter sp.]|uniref:DUF899 domain-containing protein n=1 Tax=Ilumatobacter sp. TaxID=1967498 RepID=UPI002612704C|nr:DUF899 domain-containing protein [Ilumatobacter sp.]MDJ0767613.1 DUF899 domain-containing protein [Ilumatobacter sp.]